MSRKYIETSFTSFVKHKLNETIKDKGIENKKASDNTKVNDDETAEESKQKQDKKELKSGSDNFVYEMQREFNKIWQEYDNLYGV